MNRNVVSIFLEKIRRVTILLFISMLSIVEANAQVSNSTVRKMIKQDDMNGIADVISKGTDVNTTFKRQMTMLHYAARFDKFDIVKFLVEKGADLNKKDKDENTALNYSNWIFCKTDSIALFLVRNGINPNTLGKYGSTPLRTATCDGDYELFSLLIEKGADVNFKCDECCNTSVFMNCCVFVHYSTGVRMLKLLISKNVNVNESDCKGRNALIFAIKSENIEAIKFLLTLDIDFLHEDNESRNNFSSEMNSLNTNCPPRKFSEAA